MKIFNVKENRNYFLAIVILGIKVFFGFISVGMLFGKPFTWNTIFETLIFSLLFTSAMAYLIDGTEYPERVTRFLKKKK